jgi:hypothetical protein
MLQPGRDLNFPEKPLRAQAGGQFRSEQLEGDEPLVLEVAGEEHCRHAAPAQLALERIAIGERCLETAGVVGHGGENCCYSRLGGRRTGRADISALTASVVTWDPLDDLQVEHKDLRISKATVKTHLLHIFAKLGVDDRTAAVTVAMERGMLRLAK